MPDILYNCPSCNETQTGFDANVDITEYHTGYGNIDYVSAAGDIDVHDLERDYSDSDIGEVRLDCPSCSYTLLYRDYDIDDFMEENPPVDDEEEDDEPSPMPADGETMQTSNLMGGFITLRYTTGIGFERVPDRQPCMFSQDT